MEQDVCRVWDRLVLVGMVVICFYCLRLMQLCGIVLKFGWLLHDMQNVQTGYVFKGIVVVDGGLCAFGYGVLGLW